MSVQVLVHFGSHVATKSIILADAHADADVNNMLIRQSIDSIKSMADANQLLRSLLDVLTIGVASEALLLE